MRTVHTTPMPPSCALPLTNGARAYLPSHLQTPDRLAETFRQHAPIRVSDIKPKGEQQ